MLIRKKKLKQENKTLNVEIIQKYFILFKRFLVFEN